MRQGILNLTWLTLLNQAAWEGYKYVQCIINWRACLFYLSKTHTLLTKAILLIFRRTNMKFCLSLLSVAVSVILVHAATIPGFIAPIISHPDAYYCTCDERWGCGSNCAIVILLIISFRLSAMLRVRALIPWPAARIGFAGLSMGQLTACKVCIPTLYPINDTISVANIKRK